MSSGQRTSALAERLEGARETVARSTGLKVAATGLVIYSLAVILQTGVWAAIFGIWGATLIALGLLAFGVVRWRR